MQGSKGRPPAALDGTSSDQGTAEILELTISSHLCSGAIPDPEPWSRDMYTHTHVVPTHTHICTCPICMCSHVCSCPHMYARMCNAQVHVYINLHVDILYTHAWTYAPASMYTYAYMHAYVNMCKLSNTRCIYLCNIRVDTHSSACTDVGTYTQCAYMQTTSSHVHCVHTHAHTLTPYVDTHTHACTCTHPALRTHC